MLIIVATMICVIGGYVVYNNIAQRNDVNRFRDAKTTEVEIANGLIQSVGDNAANTSEKNQCFNSGQSPYDDGYLVCQSATIVSTNSDIDIKKLSDNFVQFAREKNLNVQVNNGVFERVYIELDSGIRCDLVIKTSSGDEYGGARNNPLYLIEGPAFAVACSDEAKAKHYPFVK